jgi:hypothetical protein
MKIEQKTLYKVESKLNRQNALLAALGAAFWTIPALVLWYFVYSYNPAFGSIMLLLNGFLIGLVIRVHGQGMKPLFSVLALITHTWIVLVAFGLDIVLAGTTWAISLFGLYAAGAGVAMHIARIGVPFEEYRAYDYLNSTQTHISNKRINNRWFTALSVLVLTVTVSTSIASVGIVYFSEYQAKNEQVIQEQKHQQLAQNKEIDITPKGLEHRPTREILFYSYAYHTGLLFNKRGNISSPFPRSEYKAKTILKYLVKYRDNARAKFILGFLMEKTKGQSLLNEAVNQGDKYAKIYSAVDYGCYTNTDLAVKQLNILRKLFREESLHEEIDSILYIGFKGICSDLEDPEYLLSYVLNYKDKSDLK